MSCLELQGEVQQDTKQHDADDDQSADRVAQYQRYAASNKKDDDQRIGDQPKKTDESCETRFLQETVGSIETQSLCRLSGTQPGWSRPQQMEKLLQRPIPKTPGDWPLSSHKRITPFNAVLVCSGSFAKATSDPSSLSDKSLY